MMSLMWITVAFHGLYSHSLPNNDTQQIIKAEIVSLVNQNRDWISVDVKNLAQVDAGLLQGYYRLSWPKPPHVEVGQQWQLSIKVKSISNIANQGGFNQQKYFINRHIIYRGNVKQALLIKPNTSTLNRFKNQLSQGLTALDNGDILQALLLGQKQQISQTRWQQLRQTGSGHLIAISGLHLSVVFGVFYFLLQFLCQWWLSRRHCRHRNNIKYYFIYRAWVLLGSLACAFAYAYLAGFSVATTRAMVMLALVVSFSLLKQYSTPWDRLLYALFAVLVIDPFAMLSSGFYLSFIALMLILLTIDSRQKTMQKQAEKVDYLALQAASAPVSVVEKCRQQLCLLWSIQWRLGLGLSLLQALLFGYISPHSIWLNLLFVPWFSIVVIPVAILSLCLWSFIWASFYFAQSLGVSVATQYISALFLGHEPWLTLWLFTPANISLHPFNALLTASSSLPFALLTLPEPLIAAVLLFILLIILLAGAVWFTRRSGHNWFATWPRRLTGLKHVFVTTAAHIKQKGEASQRHHHYDSRSTQKRIFSLLAIPVFIGIAISVIGGSNKVYDALTSKQLSESWQMHVLDVGQGSAIVIKQNELAILYDTGAKYGDDFSYAQRVILPFLQARGIKHLSHIVISHNDNDHAGGLKVLADHFQQAIIVTDINSVLAAYPLRSRPCKGFERSDNTLKVEAVGYGGNFTSDNNQSCVMLLSDNVSNVLLTGDIEHAREQQLISENKIGHVDIVFAPHHGSETSSSESLLTELTPTVALFNAGFANQYGFPKQSVLNRYHQRHIQTYVTGTVGQISVDFNRFGYNISTYRGQLSPFWYNRLFKFGEKVKAE
ncbi:DUF4131 domain-containing protein [Shewanella intestini]|uniref:DUF4131 domain-containing protein n=2 Tax=Shewanellaceae TaxID=267890 RepID=A0ABS5HZ23_9GAMM|nr:DUF4131 domain-containing protein [Shewanella intestini]